MEKFDINELLRYLTIGIFFIGLNYLTIEISFLKEQIAILGNDNIATILIGLSLISGTIIYVLYRALFYPLLINPLATRLTNKMRRENINEFLTQNTSEIIAKTDIKRWKIKDENVLKRLYEWASQIHFLYNLAICCLWVFFMHLFLPSIYTQNNKMLIYSACFFIIAFIHHVRYKKFEIQILKMEE